jgi:hypothetical protein
MALVVKPGQNLPMLMALRAAPGYLTEPASMSFRRVSMIWNVFQEMAASGAPRRGEE